MILTGCYLFYSAITFAQTQESKEQQQDSVKATRQLKEVVITGTRFKIPVEKSGKTIYTISPESIEHNAGKTVVDVLNEVPGIQTEGNFSSPGTNIGTFVRGGRSKNVLILIDGVPLNDPSGSSATYDLRLLSINLIESIEVLKGGLSTLYGTGASSGVINIKLKENNINEKITGGIDVNYGSYQTFNTSANVNGQLNKFSYLIAGSYLNSQGFSAASDENATTDFDKDGMNKANILTKLGYRFSDNFKLDGIAAYDEFKTEYDQSAFTDADNKQYGKMFRLGLTPTYKYAKGFVELKTIYAENNRDFISSYPTSYKGKNLQLDLNNKHQFTSKFTALWGVNLQKFEYEQDDVVNFDDSDFTILDPYASLFYENKNGFNLHIGVRLNSHSVYNSKFIYNINPSYIINLAENAKVKLFSSLSTSYVTPTGYQLFSNYGNKNLEPEESLNTEFGSSFYFGSTLEFNIAYFNRKETNPIDFVFLFDGDGNYIGGEYQNISDKRNVEGVEMDVAYNFSKTISLLANYAYINNEVTAAFYRIPKHKAGATLNVNIQQSTSVSAKYNFTGKRTVFDFSTSSEISLSEYSLFDIYAQHKLSNDKLTVYGAVNNLFDKDFVSLYGFTTRGRNYNIGFKYNF